MKQAVAVIVFNRPKHALELFNKIYEYGPRKLFVIADGPRPNINSDKELTDHSRRLVDGFSWSCPVYKNFSDINLGLRERIRTGLDWVFEQVDRAIILEDDCLPDDDFFRFCELMLVRYSNNSAIGAITGNNHQRGKKVGSSSYYFSKYPHCWGWATWRRAWRFYDDDMSGLEEWLFSKPFHQFMRNPFERRFWRLMLKRTQLREIASWNFVWCYALWSSGMMTITPQQNLVSNNGFDQMATNTLNDKSEMSSMATGNLVFPLKHPNVVRLNHRADERAFSFVFYTGGRAIVVRFIAYLLNIFDRR